MLARKASLVLSKLSVKGAKKKLLAFALKHHVAEKFRRPELINPGRDLPCLAEHFPSSEDHPTYLRWIKGRFITSALFYKRVLSTDIIATIKYFSTKTIYAESVPLIRIQDRIRTRDHN